MNKSYLIVIISLAIIGSFIFGKYSSNPTRVAGAAANNRSSEPTETVSRVVYPTVVPTEFLTATPAQMIVPTSSPNNTDSTPSGGYQNYGWYIHNGVSMQYVDGNWYSDAQSLPTPTDAPRPKVIFYPVYYPTHCWTEPCF